jgi:hypothetical protein
MEDNIFQLADLKYQRDTEPIIARFQKEKVLITHECSNRGALNSGAFINSLLGQCYNTMAELSKAKLNYDIEALKAQKSNLSNADLETLISRQEDLLTNLIELFALPSIPEWAKKDSRLMDHVKEGLKNESLKILESAKLNAKIDLAEVGKLPALPTTDEITIEKLDFIISPDLRSIIERDIKELNLCIRQGTVKVIIVLCGSIIEAILLDLLSLHESESLSATKKGKGPIYRWNLENLIDVALELNLINTGVTMFSHSLREYRNLIHPGRELRDNLKVAPEEAAIAVQVLKMVLR